MKRHLIVGGKTFKQAINFNINGLTILTLYPNGTFRYAKHVDPTKDDKRVARLIAQELKKVLQEE